MTEEDKETSKTSLRKVRPFIDVPAPKLKELVAMRERIENWKNRETWRLWEACDLALHVPPVRGFRDVRMLRAIDSEDLCERAIRAAVGGSLVLVPGSWTAEPTKEAWVRPIDFARWVSTQGYLIDNQRTQIFIELFPLQKAAPVVSDVRAKVLFSGYSTPAFDAAIAAIAEFWLDAKHPSQYPGKKVVIAWLVETLGLSVGAADEVDRMIRLSEASKGGRKPAKQKTQ